MIESVSATTAAAAQGGLPPGVTGMDHIGGRVTAREALTHNEGNAATGGIRRVRGPGGSAVLKIARPPSPEPVDGR
jgi:hypothetical protein